MLDLWNIHKKKFQTDEIATIKNFGPTKYTQEKILEL